MLERIAELGENCLNALCILAQFDKGLPRDLLKYTPARWEELYELKKLGMAAVRLIEKDEEVIFIPKLIRRYLSGEQPLLMDYGRKVFLEKFDEFPLADASVFSKILSLPGGFDFVLTMMRLEKVNFDQSQSNDNLGRIRALLYFTYEPLYASARWGLALELIQFHNYSTAPDLLRAIDWINEAKSAEVLGMQDLLKKCILNAEQKGQSTVEKIMLLQLKAGLSKISGNFDLLPEMLQQYKDAEQLVLSLEEKTDQFREGYTLPEIVERKGILYHNRAIVQYWWAKDEEAAFTDIREAINCYRQAGKPIMEHVSISEYADMRVSRSKTSTEFDSIIRDLLVARNFFSSNQISGDLATTYLRLARVYTHYAGLSDMTLQRSLLQTAVDFYLETAISSDTAGMHMQEMIAKGHLCVLQGPGFLGKFNQKQAIQKLSEIIEALYPFASHSWARRNIRNLRWQKAQLTEPADKVGRLSTLFTALQESLNVSLNNKSKTDTGIATQLIHECLEVIGNDVHEWNEFIVQFRDPIMNWFGFIQFSTIEELQQLVQHIHPIKPYYYG
jgi:hypothetical protein